MKNLVIGFVAAAMLAGALCADADVVIRREHEGRRDRREASGDAACRENHGPSSRSRVFEAVSAITGRYPAFRAKVTAPPGASVEAAVASATRTALLKLMPAQQAAIDADYQAALKPLADGRAKSDGNRGWRAGGGSDPCLVRRRRVGRAQHISTSTTAGVYVPTMFPAVPHWGQAQAVGDGQRRPVPPRSLRPA